MNAELLDVYELATAASPHVTALAAQLMERRGCPWPVSGDSTTIAAHIRAARREDPTP